MKEQLVKLFIENFYSLLSAFVAISGLIILAISKLLGTGTKIGQMRQSIKDMDRRQDEAETNRDRRQNELAKTRDAQFKVIIEETREIRVEFRELRGEVRENRTEIHEEVHEIQAQFMNHIQTCPNRDRRRQDD